MTTTDKKTEKDIPFIFIVSPAWFFLPNYRIYVTT